MTTMPTRQQVDRVGDLDFNRPMVTDRNASITITAAPDGLRITCEYSGPISSIPAAVERLRAAGVLSLVEQSTPGASPALAPANAPRTQRPEVVDPTYDAAGNPTCPTHRRALQLGQRGLFCPAKAEPGQAADRRGYCGLRFIS